MQQKKTQNKNSIHTKNTFNGTQASCIAGSPVRGIFGGNKLMVKEYQKQWRLRNLERYRAQQKEYRARMSKVPGYRARRNSEQREYERLHPDKKEHRYFLTRRINGGFNLSFEEYKKLIDTQKGLCAICDKKDNGRALTIDHCHKTKKVRGLLCKKCNTAIGMLEDNPSLIEKAFWYLIK